jgi:dihydrofolate reductase
MPKLRVHSFSISLDGYAAGPDQSLDNPLGVGGTRLHEWALATRSARRLSGMDGGEEGVDDEMCSRGDVGVGATIMGRNMFDPIRGPWGDESGRAGGGPTRPTTIPCSS